MIAHMFKLVWNRKRANVLLVGEILCAFLVVFAVATFGLYYADNYRRPTGFDGTDVWSIACLPDFNVLARGGNTELGNAYARIHRELQQFPEVVAVAGAEGMVPYSLTSTTTSWVGADDASINAYTGRASDAYLEVLGLTLTEGRWFDASDAALARPAVVLTEHLRRELFGTGPAVGQIVHLGARSGMGVRAGDEDQGSRVIGVVADFRRSGEFAGIDPVLFQRLEMEDAVSLNRTFPSHFLLKMRPGTPMALQERLAARMQSITTDLRAEFSTVEQNRAAAFRWRLLPLWIGVGVAGVLLGMVALSLLGVLWQSVTQRTAEIGLRRAVGGPVGRVQLQFVGELLVVATIAIAIGSALIVQFPLLDLMSFVSDGVYAASLGVAALVVYLLALGCGLYPSLMATRIAPADALHYE